MKSLVFSRIKKRGSLSEKHRKNQAFQNFDLYPGRSSDESLQTLDN